MDIANAADNPAIKPPLNTDINCGVLSSFSLPTNASLLRIIVVQATNIAAKAENIPDIKFTAKAMSEGLSEKNFAK